MMKKISLYIICVIILCLFGFNTIQSQDIHYSQYFNSPLNLSPAKAGFFRGSHRFTGNYKNQWQSVTVPYRTFTGSFDMPLHYRSQQQDMVGAGLLINRDKAGDADYGTTQLCINLSYIKALNRLNNNYLSFGVQTGLIQRSFDQDKLYFDSQYTGYNFNPQNAHGENFSKDNFMFFDMSAGVYWSYQMTKDLGFDAGFSLFHLNKPNQSVFNEVDVILNTKTLLFAHAYFLAYKDLDLAPGFFYAKQGNFKELLIGTMAKYNMSPNVYTYTSFNAGIYFRTKDAAIIMAGLDYLQYAFAVSYDINYSNLRPASRNLGGLELSVRYLLDVQKNYKRNISCPIF